MLERWTDPAWLAEAHAWIRSHVSVTGEIEQPHVRPWSTVLRVPTADGAVWFKANTEEFRYEAALTSRLASRRPDAIPPLLAADLDRGWLLMDDAGTTLRTVVAEERSLDRWLDVLPLYAGVQIDLAGEAPELVDIGVPDMRLAVLPHKLKTFLDELGGRLGDEGARLRERLPWVRAACEELASYGVPETIQHDDFHDAQVFVRDGDYLLMDWSEACVAHPFFTLSVTLEGVIAWGLDDEEHSEPLDPYRSAYAEPFERAGLIEDSERALDLALRLGWICRSVNGHVPYNVDHTRTRLRMFLDG